jgi:tetratricopeptide (TPR) repeat protein
LTRGHGKAFDIKAFARGFGEAFDARGFAEGFRSAFNLREAGNSFAAGFRDGADLLRKQVRRAVGTLRPREEHEKIIPGQLVLQRLRADMAGGGGAAAKALREIRDLMRPYNPRIDAIPDDHLPGLVERILEDLEKPAARPEDFTGAVGRALAEAQARAAELAFGEAAQVLDAALAHTEADDRDRAHGRAALLAERGRIARLQLHYREAAGFYQRAAEAVAFDVWATSHYPLDAAHAYYTQGEEFGDNDALREAIASYRSALDLVPRERVPLQWATTQNNLGNALRTLGARESGTARLEQAVGAYRAALEEYTRDRVPLDWAMTQNNLAEALKVLSERESGTVRRTRLEEAIAAYDTALTVFVEGGTARYAEICRTNREQAIRLLQAIEVPPTPPYPPV